MDYTVMDNKGIIEDFETEEEAFDSIKRIREENIEIQGDLKIIKILGVEK